MHLFGTAYLCCLTLLGVWGEKTNRNDDNRSCDIQAVQFDQCQPNESCMEIEKGAVCRCKVNFKRNEEGFCQPVPTDPTPSPASNSKYTADAGGFGVRLVLWILVPVLLAAAIGGLIYTGRQKMWLSRFYRLRVRSYNNVLVGSQDDDDPPIA